MRLSCFLKKALSLSLALLFVLIPLAQALPASASVSPEFSPNFGEVGGTNNISLSPSQLLELLYMGDVSEAEAAYADKYFDNALIYGADIPADTISTQINGDTLSVTAAAKSYTSESGTSVTWVPTDISYGETSLPAQKSEDAYSASFTLTDSRSATVSYRAVLTLDGDYVLSLANLAYLDKAEAEQIKQTHSAALEEYNAASAKYSEYLAAIDKYESDLVLYKEYLRQKEIYDARNAEYTKYLSDMAKFEKDYAAYQKYLSDMETYNVLYKQYTDDCEKNAALYDEYRAYLVEISKINTSMAAMESLFVTPTNGVRELYEALQNAELVAMIERHQDKLVSLYGVKQSDITAMRRTSDELNALLSGYNDARNVSHAEAFAYYKAHYAEITQKFNYLYEKMSSILTKRIFQHICALLETVEYPDDPEMATYKKWRIRNVLCHIYLICYSLDDSKTLGNTWNFYQDNGELFDYDFADLLSQNVILSDQNSANPASLSYPVGDYSQIVIPTPPTKPAEVAVPVLPHEVAKPTPPTPVKDPGERPAEVSAPTERPQIENFELVYRTDTELANTELSERALPSSLEIQLTHSIERPFSTSEPLDIYYNYDGSLISYGTEPASPTRPPSVSHTYTFSSWRSKQDGNTVIHTAVYESAPRAYTVTFKAYEGADGVLMTQQYLYGETPAYTGETPTRPPSNDTVYTFNGWSPALSAVKADTVYVGKYTESERLYRVSWKIFDDTLSRELPYGASPTEPTVSGTKYEGGVLYEFKGWDAQIETVSRDITYTALFERTVLADSSLPNTDIKVEHYGNDYTLNVSQSEVIFDGLIEKANSSGAAIALVNDKMTLKLDKITVRTFNDLDIDGIKIIGDSDNSFGYVLTDAEGNPKSYSTPVLISVKNPLSVSENLYAEYRGYARSAGVGYAPCYATADKVELEALPMKLYTIKRYYSVSLTEVSGGTISVNGSSLCRGGDIVTIQASPNPEQELTKLFYTSPTGESFDITKQRQFVMPEGDVSVGAEFSQKKYTVTFMNGEKVISQEKYLLGDIIVIPEIPLSYEENGYTYTFVEWSSPISVVTGNAVFRAIYRAVPTSEKQIPNTESATSVVWRELILPLIISFVLIIAAAVLLTISIKRALKTSKRRKAKEQSNDKQTP